MNTIQLFLFFLSMNSFALTSIQYSGTESNENYALGGDPIEKVICFRKCGNSSVDKCEAGLGVDISMSEAEFVRQYVDEYNNKVGPDNKINLGGYPVSKIGIQSIQQKIDSGKFEGKELEALNSYLNGINILIDKLNIVYSSKSELRNIKKMPQFLRKYLDSTGRSVTKDYPIEVGNIVQMQPGFNVDTGYYDGKNAGIFDVNYKYSDNIDSNYVTGMHCRFYIIEEGLHGLEEHNPSSQNFEVTDVGRRPRGHDYFLKNLITNRDYILKTSYLFHYKTHRDSDQKSPEVTFKDLEKCFNFGKISVGQPKCFENVDR